MTHHTKEYVVIWIHTSIHICISIFAFIGI